MVVGGAALALGIKPRLAALGLAATLVPTTYVGHQFWKQTEPAARRGQQIHFNKNVAIIGGLLTYALTARRLTPASGLHAAVQGRMLGGSTTIDHRGAVMVLSVDPTLTVYRGDR